MILVQLSGGLGNQLFQYAHGRSLAVANGDELLLDLSQLQESQRPDTPTTPRVYELHRYNVKATVAAPAIVQRFRKSIESGGRKRRLMNWLRNMHVMKEGVGEYCPLLRGNTYVLGTWQSESYFRDVRHLLDTELRLRVPLSAETQRSLTRIESVNAIAIHFRRGDYVTNPDTTAFHGVCPPDYYRNGIAYMREKVENPVFFVFSDDVPAIRGELSGVSDVVFPAANPPERGHEDLALMAACKHHIIANSSFSWWGAWLAQTTSQIVVAPARWFLDEAFQAQVSTLLPKHWVQL